MNFFGLTLFDNTKKRKNDLDELNQKYEAVSKELVKEQEKNSTLLTKYGSIISQEEELKKSQDELETTTNQVDIFTNKLIKSLQKTFYYDCGLYEPTPNFQRWKTRAYETKLQYIKYKCLKILNKIYSKNSSLNYLTIEQGKFSPIKHQNRKHIALGILTFFSEANLIIKDLNKDNIQQLKITIKNSFTKINDLLTSRERLSTELLEIKIEELTVIYECMLKYTEAEEQKRKKLEQQTNKTDKLSYVYQELLKLKEEETLFQKQIKDLEEAIKNTKNREQKREIRSKIKYFKDKIKEIKISCTKLNALKSKAKPGYVCIASNIGSFGENIYTILCIQNLEPEKYLNELSVKVVPFPFDINFQVFCRNAEEIVDILEASFEVHRVNKVNADKKFYRLTPAQIESKLKEISYQMRWISSAMINWNLYNILQPQMTILSP